MGTDARNLRSSSGRGGEGGKDFVRVVMTSVCCMLVYGPKP